jgi:hypothetical protein
MLADILRLPNGARFYRADLHNHTPRDPAFHCGGLPVDTDEQKQAFAREYVRFARLEQQLDIIGVTEHNDVSWLPYLQTAAAELNAELEQQAKPERLVVMPGVEVSAMGGQRGIHFIVLFDPDTAADQIDHWISSLGLLKHERFHPDKAPRLVQKNPIELLKASFDLNSDLRRIPIAAHAFAENGLLSGNNVAGEQRALAYTSPCLLAVEIPDRREALSPWGQQVVSGELEIYQHKRVACLNHSDGRGLRETKDGRLAIGARSTRIKLSHVSVEGLRQAFIDFESRIRLEGEVQKAAYPQILGVEIEGGFLAQPPEPADPGAPRGPFRLHLNPNLNTVIGGRGVGKSALIEVIRYAFDRAPKSDETRDQAKRMLDYTFRAGSKITVYYQLPDGTRYRIERVRDQLPRVIDEKNGQILDGLQPNQLTPGGQPVEIYGQKEIYEISTDVTAQLALLDNYLSEELKPLAEQESDLLRDLTKNAEDILRFEQDIADAEQRLAELPAIQAELTRLQQRDAIHQLSAHNQLERERALLTEAEQDLTRLNADLESFAAEHPPLAVDRLGPHLRTGLPHAELLARQAALLSEIDALIPQRFQDLRAAVAEIWARGSADRMRWQADYDRVQDEYQALLREVQDASVERFAELNRRREMLLSIQTEVAKRRERIRDLKEVRRAKLAQLRTLRREQRYPLRQRKAQELTVRLGDALRVTVELEGQRETLQEYLQQAFAGGRITKGVIENLVGARTEAGYFDPIDLAEAIRHEQAGPTEANSILAQRYGISEAYRKRLATLAEDILFRLESVSVPDKPDICLKVGEQYRSLFPPPGQPGLSTGQKCTAILSLILVERNTPLIIDQPEDDLDNQFIFDEIVQTLRREKENRQFLIATHNANLPVSGDAELIIVLAADERGGWIAQRGSIDDQELREPVENILEGGRDAFRIRKEKYGLPD